MNTFAQFGPKEAKQESTPAMKYFRTGAKQEQPDSLPKNSRYPVLERVWTGTDTKIDFGISQSVQPNTVWPWPLAENPFVDINHLARNPRP